MDCVYIHYNNADPKHLATKSADCCCLLQEAGYCRMFDQYLPEAAHTCIICCKSFSLVALKLGLMLYNAF